MQPTLCGQPTLEDAIVLAAKSHRGQRDKAGEPYILHILRVVVKLKDENARIVAALHDLVEDTGTTLEDLAAAGYSEEICKAVDCLSRRKDESYEAMIERVAANPLARQVKLADLEDNMDPNRRLHGEDADKRRARYEAAHSRLTATSHARTRQ